MVQSRPRYFRRGQASRVAAATSSGVTHAIGEAAALGIDAAGGDRRQKAVQQKAVGSEQFDEIKADPVGAPVAFA